MSRSLAVALFLWGCGSSNTYPDPICDSATSSWSPGTSAFEEVTEDWGLIGVEGTRVVAVDFDGDGWIDLHIHRGPHGAPESFDEEGGRRSWLLRNDEGRGFIDVTEQSGFRATRSGASGEGRAGSVVAFGDIDNDGDLDAITAVSDPNGDRTDHVTELLLNNGDGTFSLASEDLPFRLSTDAPAGVTFVDYDRDGVLDLWIVRNSVSGAPAQDHLYRGNGTGGFVEVTDQVGLRTNPWSSLDDLNNARAHSNAWSSNACDLNGDGAPELLAASYGRAPNHLWLNDGSGEFTNRSVASGYAFDDNQDYTDNQFFLCFCQANPSAAGCANAARPMISCGTINWRDDRDREPFRNGGNSGATTCADIDNDGHIDLLTSEIQHWWAGEGSDESEILFNTGDPDVVFERPGNEATGLTRELPQGSWDKGDMTNTVFDFDNDGWKDIFIGSSDYPGTRALLWHQHAPREFTRVETSDFFEHNRSHGVAVADFDGDGTLDIIVGNSRSRCSGATDCYERPQVRMFRNVMGGNFLQIDLEGTLGSNRDAVGARVQVATDDMVQTFEVGGGYGHYGAQNPHRVHVGLGASCEAEVTVTWPNRSGSTESATLPAGYRYLWVQASDDGPEIVSDL
ncbi:MAG: CRTAC1 family protein [Deltaproteobacteria bacterium]|nr:MAG: CRTAC1 family protein [Deltaproteobacteria bacterium]